MGDDADADDIAARALPEPHGHGADAQPGTTRPEVLRSNVRYRLTPPADETELLATNDPTRAFPQQPGSPGSLGAKPDPSAARGTEPGRRSAADGAAPRALWQAAADGAALRAPRPTAGASTPPPTAADSTPVPTPLPTAGVPTPRPTVDAKSHRPAADVNSPWSAAENTAATMSLAAPDGPAERAPRLPAAAKPPWPAADSTVAWATAPAVDGGAAKASISAAESLAAPAAGPALPTTPRDPWEQAAVPDLHAAAVDLRDADVDPHEVTVQLDAVQLGDGLIRRAASAAGGHDASSDGPVFVDESGRRSRRFRRLGMAVAVSCAVYAVVIVATLLSGSSDAPWLPVPGQRDEQPAGQVDTSPVPTESTRPSSTASPEPGASLSPGDSTSPLPGTSAGAPSTPVAPESPGTNADPEPTETRTTPRPGTGGGDDPAPVETTPPPDTEDPEPTPEPSESTADPTETADGGTAGTGDGPDTVAAGPGDSTPAAAGSAEEQGAPSTPAPSPEYFL